MQEVEVERAGVGDAVRLGQVELVGLVGVRQEDGDPVHQQGARQTVDDRAQHLVEIGLGIQVAAELDQRFAVVVTFAVEELVEILLHPVLERIEQQRRDRDGDHQADRSDAGEVLVEQHRSHADGREVRGGNRAGSDGVGHAALEDQVHVHQAVAEDGVAEGQRQEDQRQHGNLHPQPGHRAEQVGDDVEERERRDRQNRAARHPLHLLPQDRRFGMAVAVPQREGGRDEIRRQVNPLHAVQVPAQHFARLEQVDDADVNQPAGAPRERTRRESARADG